MPGDFDVEIIRTDFDRLALLSRDGWDHNSHYSDFLLKHIPADCKSALEIGCGTGAFARLLAKRAERVLALDLSPQMIQIAGERSRQHANIDYQVANVLEWEFPAEQFDCVASIATLHHLPMEEMLTKMKSTLKANGTLVVLDLFQGEGLPDALTSALAISVSTTLKLIKTGRVRPSREEREAWAEHGQRDSYLTLSQAREICKGILPGSQVRKHLLWRYSIIWKKAAKGAG
jgi:ubiquinone/menaquinone biosynthesis C-methylase UbiE